MAIYDIDVDFVSANLIPPQLRKPKMLAWLQTLGFNLKAFDRIFNWFRTSNLSTWAYVYDVSTTYGLNTAVIYEDNSVYMYINTTSTSGNLPSDPNYWVLVQSNFIGVDKRIGANAQKIVFEFTLNRWFRTTGIYITNTTTFTTPFVMGTSGALSSSMPINSTFQLQYLGNSYTYTSSLSDYTIFVPVAFFTTLGTTALNRENAVRNFADLYNLAGMTYTVQTY
jgi:hypothetical protein